MNIKNRTIFIGDNLDILRGVDSTCIDLIYLDPPFNSNRGLASPFGGKLINEESKNTWTSDDVNNMWHEEIAKSEPVLYSIVDGVGLSHSNSMKSYLIMMAVRLIELKRVLKDTGSIYLHTDPTSSHYLKILLDNIFDKNNFCNEIIWSYKNGARGKTRFARKHDIILFYAKNNGKHNFTPQQYKFWQGRKYDSNDKQTELWDDKEQSWYHLAECRDVWEDINVLGSTAKERTGYPTQKPLSLLKRIIEASSNEGDVVLDPFCGCATACIAAEELKRQWIGIDLSSKTFELTLERVGRGTVDIIKRSDIPTRTDVNKKSYIKIPKRKFSKK